MSEIYIEILEGNGWDREDIFPLCDYIQSFYPGVYVDVLYQERCSGIPPGATIVQDAEPGDTDWIDSEEVDELVQRFCEYEKE